MTDVFCLILGFGLLVGAIDAWLHARAMDRARAALLRALRSGSGYALELAERVKRETEGELELESLVYPVLQDLEREGLVMSWEGPPLPGGRRRRRFYALRHAEQRGAA